MVRRASGQLGFADGWLVQDPNLNQKLDKINALVDWDPMEKIMNGIYDSPSGRPSYPVLLLFKALLLQSWYNLSDYGLEEALDDRLSFRRFVCLSVSEKTPDHSVFSRFRSQLIKHNIYDLLFAELNRQLEKRGLIIRSGTLVDATVIEAVPQEPRRTEDNPNRKSKLDPEATWTKKGGQYFFGYKAHIGVDQMSELIRRVEMTPANVHDGEILKPVISEDEEWLYADKAYDSRKNHKILQENGINNGILRKANRYKSLTETESYQNRILTMLRRPIERIFGTLKRSYNYRRARYLGLSKNRLQLTMMCMAYNLKRMVKLCT